MELSYFGGKISIKMFTNFQPNLSAVKRFRDLLLQAQIGIDFYKNFVRSRTSLKNGIKRQYFEQYFRKILVVRHSLLKTLV